MIMLLVPILIVGVFYTISFYKKPETILHEKKIQSGVFHIKNSKDDVFQSLLHLNSYNNSYRLRLRNGNVFVYEEPINLSIWGAFHLVEYNEDNSSLSVKTKSKFPIICKIEKNRNDIFIRFLSSIFEVCD